MTDKEKLKYITKLTSGYTFIKLGDKRIIIDTPNDLIINESLFVYNNIIEKNKYEEVMRLSHTFLLLVKNELLPIDYDKNIDELHKQLDSNKEQLYLNRALPTNQLNKIRQQIALLKTSLNNLIYKRHSLDKYTLEGWAESATERFIFSKIVLDENYRPLELAGPELDAAIYKYKLATISSENLRLIARTEPWRSMWNTNDVQCFRKIWDEQRLLVMFSKMYNNVYEHSECPRDDIINDDDMLDGWFIVQKKSRDKERAGREQDVYTRRHNNAKEIFVVTHNEQDRKEIEEWNDTRAQIIKARVQDNLRRTGISRDRDIQEYVLESKNG